MELARSNREPTIKDLQDKCTALENRALLMKERVRESFVNVANALKELAEEIIEGIDEV